jgi:hypothetical protein
MQFIEVSITGVRSAVITLQRDQGPLRFVLFPMAHLGSPAFYRDVSARARDCELIIAEGISGHSVVAATLTLAYRLPGRRRRMGLTRQRVDLSGLGDRLITPDMTGRQLSHAWRSVPLWQRLAAVCLAPAGAVLFWLFGTRRILARYLAMDDLPSPQLTQLRQSAPRLTEALLDKRDALLVEALARIFQDHQDEQIDVAVVYGAGHMPAVTQFLAGHGYLPRGADWLTVFEF